MLIIFSVSIYVIIYVIKMSEVRLAEYVKHHIFRVVIKARYVRAPVQMS